jgi:hypothetical protein
MEKLECKEICCHQNMITPNSPVYISFFMIFLTPHRAVAKFASGNGTVLQMTIYVVDSGRGVSNSSLYQSDTEVVASLQSDR